MIGMETSATSPSLKTIAKKILADRKLNTFLRHVVKPFAPITPNSIVSRMPVVGSVSIDLSSSKHLYLDTDGNDSIASTLFWRGLEGYERDTTKIFMALLESTNVFLDIGANTGVYALVASIDNPKRRVYAFEPVPRIFNRLRKNADINGLKNIEIYQVAVTNYDGEVNLYIPTGSVPLEASTLEGFRSGTETLTVKAITIDSFVLDNGVPKVDLMKIDTEATEHLVLEGAKEVIRRDEPIIICEVLRGRTEHYLNPMLEKMGYKFFLITDKGLLKKEQIEGDQTYRFTNYVFITERRMKDAQLIMASKHLH
jgi:FkbM family methyltransferase